MGKVLDHFDVVLVRPKHSGNIGSAARIMKNVGFTSLVLVEPADPLGEEALRMASGADDLLNSARVYDSLREATSGCALCVGATSRRRRKIPCFSPREVVERVLSVADENRVALIFGPEDKGLTNDELTLCHEVVSIPTTEHFSSLNLAQAVGIVCYEVFMGLAETEPRPARRLASSGKVEAMYDQVRELLLKVGFLDPHNPQRAMLTIRQLLSRTELEEKDVKLLRGIFRQIDWYCSRIGKTKD